MRIAASVRRLVSAAGTVGLCAWTLTGCGGGNSNPVAAPTPTPAPTPVVVVQQSYSGLNAGDLLLIPLTTTGRGTVAVTVDWTFASNDLDIGLLAASDPCHVNDVDCQLLGATNSATDKPETLTVTGVPAGSYEILVVNFGPSTEALSFQVVFTGTGSASGARVAARSSRALRVPQSFAGLKAGRRPVR